MTDITTDALAPVETGRLAALLARSSKKSFYFAKDLAKARRATQFIGEGSSESSTAAYAKSLGPYANTGCYTASDVVFVSAEGDRRGRINPIAVIPRGAYKNIEIAMVSRARFIIDRPVDRNRPYNVGERQIAAYLFERGYREVSPGLFHPP